MTSDCSAFYSQNASRTETFDEIGVYLLGFLDNKTEDSFFSEAEIIF